MLIIKNCQLLCKALRLRQMCRISTTSWLTNKNTNTDYAYIMQIVEDSQKNKIPPKTHSRNMEEEFNSDEFDDSFRKDMDLQQEQTSTNQIKAETVEVPSSLLESIIEKPLTISSNQRLEESLDIVNRQLQDLDLNTFSPTLQPAGNLAAYVPRVKTLSELVKLGVDVSKVETVPGGANFLVKLDFESGVKPYILFLTDYGVPTDKLGKIFSAYPKIFKVSLGELKSRLEYFESKRLSRDDISTMVVHHPTVLSRSSLDVDKQLGKLQKLFQLTGDEVRSVVTTVPKVVTFPAEHFQDLFVSLKKMMGFQMEEIHTMMTSYPKLLLTTRRVITQNFVYLQRHLELDHAYVMQYPRALTVSHRILKERILFLQHACKLQLDPTKELFTSLDTIVQHHDQHFCRIFGRIPYAEFNRFIKTL